MATIINSSDAPSHLFSIPELDFSGDLFAERLGGPWFRLGAWTITRRRDKQGVDDVVSRQSLLLSSKHFVKVFNNLEFVGNVIGSLGKPGGSVFNGHQEKKYRYIPFHQFEFSFTPIVGEPLVFVDSATSDVKLFINPDLWLFFELEEKTHGNGIWWDPRRGVDALVRRVIDEGTLEVVEIRTDYLRKYLQARQMSLLVGHYRHLHLFDPSHNTIEAFVEGDVRLGSPEQGAKVLVQNGGLRQDIPGTPPFLQRRLHFWFEIRPQKIDIDDPWVDQPSFDPYTFTFPTRVGLVAPARWKHFQCTEGRAFEGETCDFMDLVFFRQEVLTKYEGSTGFDVEDNGSVSCHHYWGLVRTTGRIGNELLSTTIGDFAEGVPFEEWPHWKQYAVEPPSPETVRALEQEQSVPDTVNSLVKALHTLNTAFSGMALSLGVTDLNPLWCGSLDSLAGRQLKWVYLSTSDDDEFLKRATLTSVLVIESLDPASLRKLLNAVGDNLHVNDEKPFQPLGSRNLLQRLTLIAVLFESFQPDIKGIPMLVRQAEGKTRNADLDLQAELEIAYKRVRDELAPLVFLYDLRTYGGLTHAPNKIRAATAATKLGFPEKNWHRTNYIHLLSLVAESVRQISRHLNQATIMLGNGPFKLK